MKNSVKNAARKYSNNLIKQINKATKGQKISSKFEAIWLSDLSDHINICNKILKNEKEKFIIDMIMDLDTDSRDRLLTVLKITKAY